MTQINKPPKGTQGGKAPSGPIFAAMTKPAVWVHRRMGNRFRGNALVYVTTVGAHSGKKRVNPVMRFDDGEQRWLVCASAAGSVSHPGWYHNIAANPDQVWAEVDGTTHRVAVEQLEGDAYDAAWTRIISEAPSFADYREKTDRHLPILALTPQK